MVKSSENFLAYLLLACLILIVPADGKNFGIHGELFPLKEENILLVLQKQLASQFSAEAFQKLLKITEENAKHPKLRAVPPNTKESRIFYYDPTYTASESIFDTRGHTIVLKGTKVNPLTKMQLSTGLLFFDGDNSSHLKWAREQKGPFKWVLVKGNPFELELQENRPVYFDQNGFSIHKFHLQHIPARITQEGTLLKIEEIAVDEQGGP